MMKKTLLIWSIACSVFCFSQKKEMVVAFKAQNHKEAISLGQKILEGSPDNFETNFIVSSSYDGLGDFHSALPYSKKLESLAENDQQKITAFMQAMTLNYGLGDKETSKKYYNKAKNIKALENTVARVIDLGRLFGFDDFYNQWTIVETENIIFHFDPSVNAETRDKIAKTRQNAFVKVNEFFDVKLPKKIDFFAWGSNDVYNQFLKRNLGFTLAVYCVSHNRLNQTAGHEIAHNLSFWQGSPQKIRIEFINEGIGVCFDQNGDDKLETARKAYKKSPFNIKKVWAENQKVSSEVLYPVSGAFVQFLISYDKAKFLELNHNQTYENAKNIYGDKIDALIENFMDKLK